MTLFVGGFYGGSEIFRSKGSNQTDVDVIPEDGKERFPKNFTEDLKEIADQFPAKEVGQSAKTGFSGVAKFFSTITTKMLGWVYGFLKPGKTLPSYTGLIIFFFILVLILFKTIGTFYDLGHDFLKYLLIISTIGVAVFFILLFLGLI